MTRPTPLRVVDGQVIWPYSLARLRQDEPTRSFSRNPRDVELAPFGMVYPQPTPRPEINPAVERVVEAVPVKIDGVWLQHWVIEALSDAEKEAYFRQQNPPQWQAFGAAVWSMAEVNALLATALQGAPALAMALPVGLGQAAQGDQVTFMHAWQAARGAGLVADELVAALQALAEQHYLPAAFVAALGATLRPENPSRFQRWTAPDGSEWVWDQPRNELGQYLADDPETEEIESAPKWLPVEVQ